MFESSLSFDKKKRKTADAKGFSLFEIFYILFFKKYSKNLKKCVFLGKYK